MGSDITSPESLITSCKLRWFAGSSVLRGWTSLLGPKARQRTSRSDWRTFASKGFASCDNDAMTRLPRLLKPLVAGLIVTVLQLAMAVGLLAPEEPIS